MDPQDSHEELLPTTEQGGTPEPAEPAEPAEATPEPAEQQKYIVSSLLTFIQEGSGLEDDPEWEALQTEVFGWNENEPLHLLHKRIAEMLLRVRPAPEPRPPLAANPEPTEPSVDRITGLADSVEASKAIRAALASDRGTAIAVFYVHRMNFVNARHGIVLGDKVLFWCSQQLAGSVIRPNDLLFRWDGPVFVGILNRETSASQVESELQRLLGAPMHQFLELPAKTIYLPIKMSGGVVPASENTLELVRKWIAAFALQCSVGGRAV
jgi:GGDEF domain-containing protein